MRESWPIPDSNLDLSIICVDFDGVLAEDTWPSPQLGPPIAEHVRMTRWYHDQGWAIVIFTARPSAHKDRLWRWVEEQGLTGVVYDIVCDKPKAAMYIDDKGYRP